MRPKTCGFFLFLVAGSVLLSGCDKEKRVVSYTVPKEAAPAAPASPAMMNASTGLAAQTAAFTAPGWVVPAAWHAMPESPMRKGAWETGPAGAQAEISVTAFPGDVGGLQANVNRWCGQVGLPATSAPEELSKFTAPATVSGLASTRVTVANAGKAITAVLVQHAGATWFFKISGPEASVTAAAREFDAFLASVKFPAGN